MKRLFTLSSRTYSCSEVLEAAGLQSFEMDTLFESLDFDLKCATFHPPPHRRSASRSEAETMLIEKTVT